MKTLKIIIVALSIILSLPAAAMACEDVVNTGWDNFTVLDVEDNR